MLALIIALQGATSPAPTKVTIAASREVVWNRYVAYVAARGAQPQTLSKENGLIAVRSAAKVEGREDYSRAGAVCPKRPSYLVQRVSILVTDATPTETDVSLTVGFEEVTTPGWFDYSVKTLACTSNGIVEARLLAVAKGETR